MDTSLLLGYLIAGLIRFWLLLSRDLGLSDRIELATPSNSYKRLVEGITLMENGIDPYSGAVFHGTPILLHAFSFVHRWWPADINAIVFVLVDVIAAYFLGLLSSVLVDRFLRDQKNKVNSYHEDAKTHLLVERKDIDVEKTAQLTYLFHPYLIANCAARTTTVFSNLVLVLFLWSSATRRRTLSCFFLSLAAYQTFYPVMLVFPLIIGLTPPNEQVMSKKNSFHVIIPTLLTFLAFTIGLNYVSFKLTNSWNFIYSTHGFTLRAPELTPNIGLFWYFFTEMFEHFRLFFVWIFQLNCFVYVLPLSIKLRDHPFLLSWTLIALTAIFKSYPSYGDVGFYLALLPILSHLFPYMKQMFIAGNMYVAATILGPVLYQMWIYNGSANSNYFFAINLVFGVAQVLLVTDFLFAHVKREFYLTNGFKSLHINRSDPTQNPKLILL